MLALMVEEVGHESNNVISLQKLEIDSSLEPLERNAAHPTP